MSMADRIAVLNAGNLEQLATPVELYSRPATRFVASFIGSANLLDGTVVAGGISVTGVAVVPVRHTLTLGSAGTVVLRPEDTSLAANGEGLFDGVVIDTFFLGGSSTVSIAVPGLSRPISCTVHATQAAALGERVGVRFDASRAVALSNPGTVGELPTTAQLQTVRA